MEKKKIEMDLVWILKEVTDLDFEKLRRINKDNSLREELGLDSMDFLDIILELRKQYGLHIPESDYPQLSTFNSAVDYLSKK